MDCEVQGAILPNNEFIMAVIAPLLQGICEKLDNWQRGDGYAPTLTKDKLVAPTPTRVKRRGRRVFGKAQASRSRIRKAILLVLLIMTAVWSWAIFWPGLNFKIGSDSFT
jgi:hypothetical protein